MLAEAMEMLRHESAARVVSRTQTEVIHECKACHRGFTLGAWGGLHLLTKPHAPDGRYSGLEWRNCDKCQSTMCVEVEILDG